MQKLLIYQQWFWGTIFVDLTVEMHIIRFNGFMCVRRLLGWHSDNYIFSDLTHKKLEASSQGPSDNAADLESFLISVRHKHLHSKTQGLTALCCTLHQSWLSCVRNVKWLLTCMSMFTHLQIVMNTVLSFLFISRRPPRGRKQQLKQNRVTLMEVPPRRRRLSRRKKVLNPS